MMKISAKTLRNISVSIKRVNKTTARLYMCSSDDFGLLSDRFKLFYNNLSSLKNNSQEIRATIKEGYSTATMSEIRSIFDAQSAIETSIKVFKKKITSDAFKIVFNEDLFYLQLHNLIQDLTTLQLLIATIRLGNHEYVKDDFLHCDKQINKFIESIRTFYLRSQEAKQHFSIGKYIEKSDIQEEEKFNDFILLDVEQRIIENQSIIDEQLTLIEASDKTTGKSFSEVITKLQFEDIIRQKMEHISAMQEETNAQLSALDKENINEQNSLHTFAQIKEISDLQVAQIVHASKDYQQAIHSIIHQFSSISQSLDYFSTLDSSVLSTPRHSFLFKTLDQTISHYFNLVELKKTASDSDTVVNGIKHIFNLFNSFAIIVDAFSEDIDKTTEIIRSNSVTQQQHYLLSDITQEIRKKITDLTQLHAQFASHYIQQIHQYEPSANGKPHFSQQIELLSGLLDQFSIKLSDWDSKLINYIKENKLLVSTMNKELTVGIKRIKFYTQYDKLIQSIISDFSNIHKELSFANDIAVSNEVLSKFKSLYTMQSEYLIHDHVNGNESSDDLMIEYESSIELF